MRIWDENKLRTSSSILFSTLIILKLHSTDLKPVFALSSSKVTNAQGLEYRKDHAHHRKKPRQEIVTSVWRFLKLQFQTRPAHLEPLRSSERQASARQNVSPSRPHDDLKGYWRTLMLDPIHCLRADNHSSLADHVEILCIDIGIAFAGVGYPLW